MPESDYHKQKESSARLSNQTMRKNTCLSKLSGEREILSLHYLVKTQSTLVATCVNAASIVLVFFKKKCRMIHEWKKPAANDNS